MPPFLWESETTETALGLNMAAITPDDSLAVVTRTRSDVISILDLTTNPPTEMLTLPPLEGRSPIGVAITPDGTRALVTSRLVNVLDLSMTPPAFTEAIPVGSGSGTGLSGHCDYSRWNSSCNRKYGKL